MPTIPQRVASVFAVLCVRYGDVARMTQGREQSRRSLYREAQQVADAIEGAAARSQIDALQQQLARRQAEVQQDDRDHRILLKREGKKKAYSMMVRVRMPGGKGTAAKYLAVDELARTMGQLPAEATDG